MHLPGMILVTYVCLSIFQSFFPDKLVSVSHLCNAEVRASLFGMLSQHLLQFPFLPALKELKGHLPFLAAPPNIQLAACLSKWFSRPHNPLIHLAILYLLQILNIHLLCSGCMEDLPMHQHQCYLVPIPPGFAERKQAIMEHRSQPEVMCAPAADIGQSVLLETGIMQVAAMPDSAD